MKFTKSLRTSMYTSVGALLLTLSSFAQAPEKMSYQAVIRDASNALVTNQQVGMQISILQGSTAVYEETQTPTSNTNGLVTLEIGTGTIVSGIFSSIDWSADTYFIKIETDPAGGTNYTITGTSQLLSVPYALHAKTAANGITDAQATILGNTSGTNSGDQTVITSAQATAISDNTLKVGITTYSIGNFAYGGVVFWVDETGQHGLVCAKEDLSSTTRWYAGTYGNTQAKGDGPYAGKANTSIIISAQVAIGDDGSTYAARACNELQITEGGKTYGDWYLPSKDELNKMYQNKATINATATAVGIGGSVFVNNSYWSSTEYESNYAWKQHFNNGVQSFYDKYYPIVVRAVRAF